MKQKLLNIAFPQPEQHAQMNVLVGDVGGTKTHLAEYRIDDGRLEQLYINTYHSQSYGSLTEIIHEFLQDKKEKPQRMSLGVAGPVIKGKVHITNLTWEVVTEHLEQEFDMEHIAIINDLEANAYGIAALESEDIMTIHAGDPEIGGNAVIISPGTGLGEAGLYFDGEKYHPFPTEGGHTDYAPETETDIELLRWMQKKYGHVSWERVVSGMGILDIYTFFSGHTVEEDLHNLKQRYNQNDAAAAVSIGARSGDELCQKTMELFLRNLSNESANLVMKHMGTGGVFIGGGILPKNLGVLQTQEFIHYFLQAGRMSTLLSKVPVHIILNQKTALLGAALYGYYS